MSRSLGQVRLYKCILIRKTYVIYQDFHLPFNRHSKLDAARDAGRNKNPLRMDNADDPHIMKSKVA